MQMARKRRQKQIYTPKEVAHELGVHPKTVYEMIRRDQLAADPIGRNRNYRVPLHELKRAFPNIFADTD